MDRLSGWLRRHRRLGLTALGLPALLWLAFTVAVGWRPFPRERLDPAGAASLTILDAQGEILRQLAGSAGGKESWRPLDRIATHLRSATVISEDRRFYRHRGVDPVGLLRAALLDLAARRLAYGGSTLSMQLVRLLDPAPRTVGNKLREAVLAARLERVASKDEILEQYLNRVYYGHGAWGAEAAAQRYFGKPAAALSLGEASFLAVLPRGPEAYDPERHLDRALARRHHILGLMVEAGAVGEGDRQLAERTPLGLLLQRPVQRAPHFVDWVRSRLPADPRGLTVETTLDGPLQERLEVALSRHLAEASGKHLTQAGVVVLRHRDGAVLAMVGSRDYGDAQAGANNATTVRRRPGSALKPFVYGLALEQGDTAASLAYDVILPEDRRESFSRDVRQHGVARYRESLAGSYNLAAVHTLRRVGVQRLVHRLRAAGLSTLDRPDDGYDLNLAIGEAEVRVVELAAAFAAFGNRGEAVVPRPVDGWTPAGGSLLRLPEQRGPRVFSPEIAYLVYDMLSDPDARRPMFGNRAPMVLPFPVALKTGTTRAYTDNLAFAVTREYTVGVWAGNFDGTSTDGMMAMRGAAPLARAALVALAARFGEPTAPDRPSGIVDGEVCPLSGLVPGPACPSRKQERFLAGTAPREACTWHRHEEGRVAVRYPPEVLPWARFQGLASARQEAPLDGALRIVAPLDGARFALEADRSPARQPPPLTALPGAAPIRWLVDGRPAASFVPTLGPHRVRAERGDEAAEVTIVYE